MAEQAYPEPTCGAMVFNPKGELLLVKSHKWKDMYVIPGGHIELGERMKDTVKREIKEETGLDVFDIEFVCFQEFVFDDAFWKKRHFIFFDFACRTESTDVTLNSEGQEHVWVALDKALDLPVEPYTRKAIEAYLEKRSS
ncbi:NUDIX domain-containing protein [Candidatus Woesearchaeota archaeon]|nr:NUDIX domain-containing protein [Candidatus Woesearchaeota archaeon]